MKQIEFERWEPDAENPRRLTYAGQRTAEDVFHELEAQLDSVGYLPDEYFSMDWRWEHGRQIPKGADFSDLPDAFIRKNQSKISRRPRKRLYFGTPKNVFFRQIDSFVLAS